MDSKAVWRWISTHKLILVLSVSFLYILLFKERFALTFILTIVNGTMVYWQTRYQLPVDIAPMIFCLGVVALTGGISQIVFFVFFGVVLPTVVTGVFTPDAFVFWITLIVVGLIGVLLGSQGLGVLELGLIMVILKIAFSVGWNLFFGAPLFRTAINEFIGFLWNMILLLRFGGRLI